MTLLKKVLEALGHIRLAILELCLLAALLPLGLTLVLQNNSACKYWLEHIIALVPGLSVAAISGNAWQGLAFSQLHYRGEGLDITLQHATLTLDTSALWQAQLEVQQLQADGLTIAITTDTSKPATAVILPEISLPLHIGLQQLQLRNALLKVDNWQLPFQQLQVAATLQQDFLTLNNLRAHSSLYNADIRLQLYGKLRFNSSWPLSATTRWQATLPENIATVVRGKQAGGSAQLSGSIGQLHIRQQLQQPFKMAGDIHLQPLLPVLRFALQQHWQSVLLAVQQHDVQLGQGSITLKGVPGNYTGNIDTLLQVDQWPALAMQLAARGDAEKLDMQSLHIRHEHSQLMVKGQFSWLPELAWNIQGQALQLNPGLVREDFPGALDFDFSSQGNWGIQPNVQMNIDKLKGKLRGYPLGGYSHLAWQGAPGNKQVFANSTFSSNSQLDIASNKITLSGTTGQQLDINLKVEGEHLASLLPELAGKLALDAHLGGSRQQPLLSANAEGHDLRYRQWSLGKLALAVTAEDPSNIAMQLDIAGSALHYGQQLWLTHFSLNGAGLLSGHALHWQLENPQATLTGALQGKADTQGNWLMQLQQLDIDSQQAGHWALQQTTDIEWQQQQLKTGTACLAESALNALLCLAAEGDRQNGKASLTLQEVPLAPLAELLDEPLDVAGTLNARASVQQVNGELQGQVDIDGGTGYMAWLDKSPGTSAAPMTNNTTSSARENYRIHWQQAGIQAYLLGGQLHSQGKLLLDNGDNLTAQLNGTLQGDYPLQGKLALQLGSLQWLELLLPVQQVQGSLQGEVNIGGTVSQPQFTGSLALQQGSLLLPDAGIKLKNITIAATANNSSMIELQGSVTPTSETATPGNTGESGKLLLSGTIDTRTALPWPININLQGHDVLVLDRNDARVKVNPDLQLSLASTLVKVRGKVTVNQAELKPRELPKQAIKVSADARRVDSNQATSAWQLDNDIIIVLGNGVKIQGFGLDAGFTGDVRMQQAPEQPLSLSGVIHIIDGRYKIYGQNLKVERGNLLFQGPADNPGLDILAVRVITASNVRAGLEIGGTLQHSRSTVFSEPAMEESEAMAWLLTGRPLSGASQNDGNAILQAIAVYGIDQGDFISQRVGKTLGLDVGFDTEGVNDQAAFMLGKQLSTRLYLRYSVGLFETISTIMLRYSLSQNVSLETRTSGQTQSVDLLYRKER